MRVRTIPGASFNAEGRITIAPTAFDGDGNLVVPSNSAITVSNDSRWRIQVRAKD